MKNYEIVKKKNGEDERGPFSFQEIEELVEAGTISREQEVQKLDTGEIVSADYILLFDFEGEDREATVVNPKSNGLKAVLGIVMILCSIVFLAMIIWRAKSGQEVRGRQFIIVGVLGLAGAKIFINNIGGEHPDQ